MNKAEKAELLRQAEGYIDAAESIMRWHGILLVCFIALTVGMFLYAPGGFLDTALYFVAVAGMYWWRRRADGEFHANVKKAREIMDKVRYPKEQAE